MNPKSKSSPTKPTTINGVPAPLKHIELGCEAFSIARSSLRLDVFAVEQEIAAVRANRLPSLRGFAAAVSRERDRLELQIDNSRALFDSPRTRIFSNIKVGLQKQKGETVIPDKEKTLALIEKHFPDRLDELAPPSREISKKALANLTASDLKKIAVEITADTDAIIIKPQDSDIEKAVAALLKDAA